MKSPMSDSFAPGGTPREGAFNVNGMRSTYNNFLLDGVDNNAYGTSNQGYSAQAVQPSPDAIAEFKLITNNYSAEYGRVGGAVVNAVMRSGTNDFHGTAYEFLRNTDLNAGGFEFAQPYFKPHCSAISSAPASAAPSSRTSLFFFGDYEGYRQLQHNPNFDSIPTLAERQRNFAGYRQGPADRRHLSGQHADSDSQHQPSRRSGIKRPSGSNTGSATSISTTIRRCCCIGITATSMTPDSTARSTTA